MTDVHVAMLAELVKVIRGLAPRRETLTFVPCTCDNEACGGRPGGPIEQDMQQQREALDRLDYVEQVVQRMVDSEERRRARGEIDIGEST
jgi:hypothetical protein